MPGKGFDVKDSGYQAPAEDGSGIEVLVDPKSDRLQLLNLLNHGTARIMSDLALADQGQGQMHYRSYFNGRTLAEIPGAS